MPRDIHEELLRAIEEIVQRNPESMTAQEISDELGHSLPRRTLQYRLKFLVDNKRLVMESEGRWAKYRMFPVVLPEAKNDPIYVGSPTPPLQVLPLSESGIKIQEYVRQPLELRKPVGYNRLFLDWYRPNDTYYLSQAERTELSEIGNPKIAEQPSGTYAKKMLNRLLIDLSWNSSRLEGNTYSLLDTKRLIELGEETTGKTRLETQMILNHKDAIEFLVDAIDTVGFNRYTIRNLHAFLANNLLADSDSVGRLRHIGVGIQGSVFYPLEVPRLIEECFDQILDTASAIVDPFEQSFFVMVQLPYLQPFDDVNKRVARLCANIPLIKANLAQLSFENMPRDVYTESMLGVYEMNRIELLRDVFILAYKQSAARYAAVRQSVGEPDPFRMRHRTTLHEIVGTVVRKRMDQMQAATHIRVWTRKHIQEQERERFCEIAERELLSLHEGNFARYQIRPLEFSMWAEVWGE